MLRLPCLRHMGFHSPDSDYDCRFVYVRAPDWYLSINVEHQRDVIEYPIVDELDINGWDLRKALKLMAKSNPSIVEWLYSPIIYQQSGEFAALAREWLAEHYSVARGIYHYRSSAQSHYQQFLCGDQIKLKKYLYVLRPLLAVRWLERYQQIAPIEFEVLRTVLDDPAVQASMDALLTIKRQASEADMRPPMPVLQHWIESELLRLQDFKGSDGQPNADCWPSLNRLFLHVLKA
ncbi:MAG: nucleotidyltransferase domain-containing protein [Pseudomonadota bacterium]|nr:nucleotidyltransferase domain-containing protein [Pseudomonadota bacterium]